jgi:uncharacterized protein (TIGR01777 family)
MEVVVAGSSGLIGQALVARLRAEGHGVRRLVRRPAQGPEERIWDPAAGVLDPAALAGADAVVNLAGAGVGDKRLTASRKQEVLRSRTDATGLLARTIAGLDAPPRVLLQGSATGAYGERGDDVLTEEEPGGTTFLAEVVRQWEGAAAPAIAHPDVRVAFLRTGIVLAPRGGALGKLLPLLRLGVGGPLGSGRQYWSWITLAGQPGRRARDQPRDHAGAGTGAAPARRDPGAGLGAADRGRGVLAGDPRLGAGGTDGAAGVRLRARAPDDRRGGARDPRLSARVSPRS